MEAIRLPEYFFPLSQFAKDDDPDYSKFGPEILDLEIIEGCRGVRDKEGKRKTCAFCYKSNTPNITEMMSFETFKIIFDKMPRTLTQIAFGVDAEANMNPDLFPMMKYSRDNGVIPNVTVADIGREEAQLISSLCGAVAVSYYPQRDKNRCYDAVDTLSNIYGMKQVNIHAMISSETYQDTIQLIDDIQSDKRLRSLNAVVFLSLKQKGRGENFTPLHQEQFSALVQYAMKAKIGFGFDSCSAFKFLDAVKDHERYEEFKMMTEPCESTCFSSYINAAGKFFPCSFTEEGDGINVVTCKDFVKDVWMHRDTIDVREEIIQTRKECKNCFAFNV